MRSLIRGFRVIYVIIMTVAVLACKADKKEIVKEHQENIIEIISEGMDFQSPDTINSGWNTFRYANKSTETHFFLLNKYPTGKTIVDNKKEIIPPFQNGMDFINEGKPEEGFAEFNKLPKWFFDVVYFGGSGLISPKKYSLTTIKLEPGYYLMECYVKMANGKFHTSMGMTTSLIVLDKDSGNNALNATVNIAISNKEGITYEEPISKGIQIFSVHFKDQFVYKNFVGHDINLVKLSDDTKIDELENWMDWTNPKGLITPAPKGIIFLGGVNDMQKGHIAYFQADLVPGDYAFISEIPNASKKNMLKIFTVFK